MKKTFTKTLAVLFFCALGSTANALAAGTCDVPVCDVPAKIEEMKQGNQNFRYQTVSKLRSDNLKSQDSKVLRNLLDFGLQARTLFEQLNEEDWMLREVSALLDLSYVNLSKFGNLSGTVLSDFYAKMNSVTSRLDTLTFWTDAVRNVNQEARLRELFSYAKSAMKTSDQIGDPDFIAGQGARFINAISSRLIGVNPFFEGIYSVGLKCSSAAQDQDMCAQISKESYSLIVLNAEDTAGVVVSLVQKSDERKFTQFSSVVFNVESSTLEGQTSYDVQPAAHFSAYVDRATGDVKGWIRNTRFSEHFVLEGKRLRTPAEYFTDAGPSTPISAADVEGIYTGTYDTGPATLIVKMVERGRFAATLYVDGKQVGDEPTHGTLLTQQGVLTLIAGSSASTVRKMVLAFRTENGSPVTVGFFFSALDGKVVSIKLTRKGSILAPPSSIR